MGFQLLELFGQFLFPGSKLFQFVGAGQNTRFLIHRTTGHRAAGIHHLSVQSDDLKTVAVLLSHSDGGVDILSHHDSAQQIFHYSAVTLFKFHQLGRDTHITPAVLHALFLQGSALHSGDGQHGGTATAGTL